MSALGRPLGPPGRAFACACCDKVCPDVLADIVQELEAAHAADPAIRMALPDVPSLWVTSSVHHPSNYAGLVRLLEQANDCENTGDSCLCCGHSHPNSSAACSACACRGLGEFQHLGRAFDVWAVRPLGGSRLRNQAEHLPQEQIIAAARAAKAQVHTSTMLPQVQQRALDSAQGAIAKQNDFTAISDAIKSDLAAKLGGVWHCAVGMDTHYGHTVRAAKESYLVASFGDLLVVIFKAEQESQAGIGRVWMGLVRRSRRDCDFRLQPTPTSILVPPPLPLSLPAHPPTYLHSPPPAPL